MGGLVLSVYNGWYFLGLETKFFYDIWGNPGVVVMVLGIYRIFLGKGAQTHLFGCRFLPMGLCGWCYPLTRPSCISVSIKVSDPCPCSFVKDGPLDSPKN